MKRALVPRALSGLVATFIALICVTAFRAESDSGRIGAYGPYVQNVTSSGATICWIEGEARVRIGPRPDALEEAAREYLVHQVQLTGLKPSTTYYYDVLGDGGAQGAGRFVTAPDGRKPFTFVVYGDTRTRHDVHRKIVGRIAAIDPALLLHTGDLVGDGRDPNDWKGFFEIEGALLRNVPLFPSMGNHERDSPLYFKFFSLPGNERYYSFDWGGVHFIALDSSGPSSADKEVFWREQTDWLRLDLDRSRSADFICVYFHHPPFSTKSSRAKGAEFVRRRLAHIFEAYRVDIVFNGHDHNYQHHLNNGVHYVVTGGGGAPLYDTERPLPGVTVKLAKVENFVKVNVSENAMEVEAIDIDGQTIERFAISKKQRTTAAQGS